jgi:branched-chain amino acid transport system permease protein
MLNLFLLQSLNGIQFGILLFLVAAGLTLIFGVMDLINLAHGVLYMVGAYLTATFTALPVTLVIGIVLEVLVFRRLYERSHLDQVLATFGLILIVNELVKIIWGAAPLSVPMPDALSGSIQLFGNLRYPVYRLLIIAAGLLTAAGLYVLVTRASACCCAPEQPMGIWSRRSVSISVACSWWSSDLAQCLRALPAAWSPPSSRSIRAWAIPS